MRWRRAAVGIALTLAGCHLLADYDELAPEMSPDPIPVECTRKDQCPDAGGPCVERACIEGACAMVPLDRGSACRDDSSSPCDGNGKCAECVEDNDCSGENPVCVDDDCKECAEPQHCLEQPGTTCNDFNLCVCPLANNKWCEHLGACVDIFTSSDNCNACNRRCYGPCIGGVCQGPWQPLPLEDAPSPRTEHAAVSTLGDTLPARLIIWGGATGPLPSDNTNTGAVYDPLDDYRWSEMSIVGAPSPRRGATAVWTGPLENSDRGRMIVWGGFNGVSYLGDGAIYDPQTNTWSAMSASNAPSPRSAHTAVWTGEEGGRQMIVWGGTDGNEQLADGKRYLFELDTWADMEPISGRERHAAVWVGSRTSMVIYGGIGDTTNLSDVPLPADGTAGGLSYSYDAGDSQDLGVWTPLETSDEPSARVGHTLVAAAAAQIVVWGGHDGVAPLSSGGRLDLTTGTWEPFANTPPAARSGHTAVFVDKPSERVMIWGGDDGTTVLGDGAELDVPSSSSASWRGATVNALSPRSGHSAARADDDSVFIWGGVNASGMLLGDGGIYRLK